MKKHILLDLSFHGFGHVAQSGLILGALMERRRDIELTIRTTAPGSILSQRFPFPFRHLEEAFDFGIPMKNALEVDGAAARSDYAAFHAGWAGKVAEQALKLETLAPDLVLANVPYLSLAAAARAGISSVGFCSLNWADLYAHYCGGEPECGRIHAEILGAYRSASAFLRITPGMPMRDLPDAIEIGPVGRRGRDRRDESRERLGIDGLIGLVSMGGMPYRIDFRKWPLDRGIHWLVPEDQPGMTAFDRLGMPFVDLIASSDVMVTKPGYGSFVEAALAGTAVIYVSRGDWPEEPHIVSWLKANARCAEAGREEIETGRLDARIESLLGRPVPPPVAADGVGQAADFVESMLT